MDIYEERIKPLFDSLNMDDKEVERLFKFPKDALYNWEHHVTKSYNKRLPQIASYFGVSVDYLTGARDDKTPAAPEGDGLREDELRLLELYNRLNEEGREKLLDSADDLVQSGKYIKRSSGELAKEA